MRRRATDKHEHKPGSKVSTSIRMARLAHAPVQLVHAFARPCDILNFTPFLKLAPPRAPKFQCWGARVFVFVGSGVLEPTLTFGGAGGREFQKGCEGVKMYGHMCRILTGGKSELQFVLVCTRSMWITIHIQQNRTTISLQSDSDWCDSKSGLKNRIFQKRNSSSTLRSIEKPCSAAWKSACACKSSACA